jgi:hypothetical protein
MRRTGQEASRPAIDCDQLTERRCFERYRLEIPTLVEPVESNGTLPRLMRTSNISALGAQLSVSDDFPQGSKIRMSFILEFSESVGDIAAGQTILITVTGSVLRSDASGVAVCFDEDYSIVNFDSERKPKLNLH